MINTQYQNIKSFKVPKGFRGKSIFIVQLWFIVSATIFRFSPRIANNWRKFLLIIFGAKIGKDVLIRPSAKILYPWNLSIGNYSWIGDQVTIYNMGKIDIGNNTVISQKSYLCNGSHDHNSSTFDLIAEPISIGNEVWIATDVFVAPNVTIGNGTVIGYRSTVTKNLPPNKICVGNPARPIKNRKD
jgi:putative colanic acid biosynthesis acetyltransferase WcaF